MKKLTLLLLIVLNINSVAQNNYFEKKILWGYLLQQIWKVENTNNGEYVVLGHILESGLPYTYSFFSKMNANGDIYPPVYYKQDTANYYATDLLANEQGYAISIAIDLDTHNHPQYHDNMYFVQTDTNGQILYQHPIGYPGNTNSNDLMSMIRTPEDGGYLLVGFLSLPFGAYYRPYLVKLNSSGEKQWEKIINEYDATQDNVFNDVVRTPNGEYYAVGGNELETNTVGAVLLAQLDITNGNIIQQWNYNFDSLATNNQSLDDGTTIIALDDGGLLIGLKKENVPQWGSLLRLNSNKEIVWVNNQVLNDCGPRKLLYLPTDGSFVTTGCATVLYPAVSDGVQVEISKVSATGSLLWKRHYGTDHADDYAWDMVSTPDGGFMVVGRSYSIFWQQVPIYLLKTNCMGLLTLPQANFTTAMDTAAMRASFYNTSQYIYPDSIDGGHYLWQFGDGATSAEQNPTHTYAQGGNYTVTLTAVVCSDTSVFLQAVSTWAVGNELLSANNLVKVFPNPANSYLTVVTTPATQGGNLVLYDMLGRAVKQVTLSNVNTSINVSDLCAGVYLYEVFNSYSSSKQKVTYGKVNVLH